MKRKDESAYERILTAAAKLFALQGFEGTTTRQIVAEAGSSLSAIQMYFKSKEILYEEVMKRTQALFSSLNSSFLEEINEMERQGFLDKQTAWDMIVQLTGRVVDWAFQEEYRYEILLMSKEFMQPKETRRYPLSEENFRLYRYYEKLFKKYMELEDDFWIRVMSFTVVTALFDYANYPYVLERILDVDFSEPGSTQKAKAYVKRYLLSSIRANLDMRREELERAQ